MIHCNPGLQVARFNVTEFIQKKVTSHVENMSLNDLLVDLTVVFVPTNAVKDMVIGSTGTTYQSNGSQPSEATRDTT